MTTKLHAAVNRLGRLLRLTLTPGQRNDSTQAATLLEEFEPDEVERVVADASYDSDAIRARTKELKAEACIKAIRARRVKKTLRQAALQTPQRHRTLLRPNQKLPPRRHPIRQKTT